MDWPHYNREPLYVDDETFVAATLPPGETRFGSGATFVDFYLGFTEEIGSEPDVEFVVDFEPILIWEDPDQGTVELDPTPPTLTSYVATSLPHAMLRIATNNVTPAYGTTIITVFLDGVELAGKLHVTYTPGQYVTYGNLSWYTEGDEIVPVDEGIISKIYLDSGEYEISVAGSESFDLNSYIETAYGRFVITPIKENLTDPFSIEKFQVKLDDTLIGEVFVYQFGLSTSDTSNIGMAMAAAIDIVTNKVEEFIEQEERHLLALLAEEIKSAVDMSEEQKAILRTYIIEGGLLPAIQDEMANPTDIMGLVNGA